MSLSALLIQQTNDGNAIDKGLDELFRASAPIPKSGPSTSSNGLQEKQTVPSSSKKKRKAVEETPDKHTKRLKLEKQSASKRLSKHKESPVADASRSAECSSEDEEAASEARKASSSQVTLEDNSDESDDDEPSRLVHETLKTNSGNQEQSQHGKSKYVPTEETTEQRDERTVFVGNVAVVVTKSRPTQKQLKRHILSFVPSAKIESVRFRSIAFKNPTSELPSTDESNHKQKARERASAWRGDDKDESAAAPAKRFLTPKEKKRVAFIKHEIHELADSVNAYVVFAHPPPPELLAGRPSGLPFLDPIMDPYEAARRCVEKGDGSMFLGRTLRVDVVKKSAGPSTDGEADGMAGDPKATVFVGNLDFASKDEDLRAFFESLMCAEMGQPGEQPEESGDEDESDGEAPDQDDAKKSRTWVKRVRIIRDRDTQLGKGFAYVQFVDRNCTDEVLALDQSKLKFAKRKLRVQRCKTLPGGPKLHPVRPSRPPPSSNFNPSSSKPAPAPRLVPQSKQIPRGNPELGRKLAHLPKEERKKVKAADPDRVARRLAKKRASALAEKGVKAHGTKVRVRERANEKKADMQQKDSRKGKKRVRSGQALSKMNTKK